MSATHTPTPWLMNEDHFDDDDVEITSQIRLDNSMCEIATVEVGGFYEEIEAEQRANAEFIVLAVNCHDDLVAALKEIAFDKHCRDLRGTAERALAKAEDRS